MKNFVIGEAIEILLKSGDFRITAPNGTNIERTNQTSEEPYTVQNSYRGCKSFANTEDAVNNFFEEAGLY
jgi:hypothetical protein